MSASGWYLVDLGAREEDAQSRADRITDWLLYEQMVIPNPTRDDLWQPSALAPGPAWRKVTVGDPSASSGTTQGDEFLRVANNGIDVEVGWARRTPEDGGPPPRCAWCASELDAGEHRGLVESWLESRSEPSPTCLSCDRQASLGSWLGPHSAGVGHLAVAFNHWPAPRPAFLLAAGARLSSRLLLVTAG